MIRQFRPLDIWAARRLITEGDVLDLGKSLLSSYDPLVSAMASCIPYGGGDIATYLVVARGEGDPERGLVQTLGRPDGSECVVAYVAPGLRFGRGTNVLWSNMLVLLCKRMAQEGVLRIFAKGPPEADEAFRAAEFSAYAQERFFRLHGSSPRTPAGALKLRMERAATDGGGLRLLYERLTPGPVRSLAGLEGVLGELEASNGRDHEESFVLDDGGDILGHVRLRSGEGGHLLKLALRSDSLGWADELVGSGLSLLAGRPAKVAYCCVAGYQGGLGPALERRGFEPLASQTLWVRHTAISVKRKEFQVARRLERGAEPARPAFRGD